MRRAEQVISGLPPGPAANATLGPPRRAERRPPPSPRRAVHLGPKDTERNAIRRRYARAPAAHRDEHLDEPTERASRIHTGQRAERHAVTYAPSGSLDRTTRSHAPSSRPSRRHRAAAPHDVFHRRTAEGARTTSSFRSSPPSGGRCQPPREFRRLAPSATSQQTAPRQAQRFADHRAEQNADHHRGPPPNSTSGPEDTERSAIRRRYARAPAVLRDPPRRTPRRAHRAYRPQNPRDQPGGGHSLTTTHRVSPVQTRRRVLRTRKSTGLDHEHRSHGRTSNGTRRGPSRMQTRSTRPAAGCHVRAEWQHREDNPTHAPSSRPPRRHRAAAPRHAFHRKTAEGARTTSDEFSHEVEERCQPPQEFGTWRRAARFKQTAPRQAQTGPMTHRAKHVRGRLPPGPAANAARGPPRRAERRLPPSPRRAVHRNLIARQAESGSTVSSPSFACRSRIVASCSESRDAVPPAKTSSNPSIAWRFQAPTWFGWNFVLGGDRLHGKVPA